MKENTILRAIIIFLVIGIAAYWFFNTYEIAPKTQQESVKTEYFDERSNTYVREVVNPATGRVWMDRNLGASRAATSSTDDQAYGDLYQWGRAADGHQKRTSATTTTVSSTNQPGHGSFILSNFGANNDWRNPRNDNLWQGVNGINNPCPVGYRLPTEAEWNAELASWSSLDASGAHASQLKLTLGGGFRHGSSGLIYGTDILLGTYWSSTVNVESAKFLEISSHAVLMSWSRATGLSVRCIKD
jgi:uncharacterized protein (TIGR02145 family)